MSLILDIPAGPRWVPLKEGVEVLMAPVTTAVVTAAQARAARLAREAGEGMDAAPDPDFARGLSFMLLCQALARFSVTDWRGVHGEDGQPLSCTPEGLDALMGVDSIAVAFFDAAMAPVRKVDAEGNG